jgi:hypothetical protein
VSRREVIDAFVKVRALVARGHPEVLGYGLLLGCPTTERDHAVQSRRYMHVGHQPGCVCASRSVERLPRKNLVGLFLHEFGHIIGGPEQWDADMGIFRALGISILYDRRGVEFVEVAT